jgi:hypothetical protein
MCTTERRIFTCLVDSIKSRIYSTPATLREAVSYFANPDDARALLMWDFSIWESGLTADDLSVASVR